MMSEKETIQKWKKYLGSDPRWAIRGLLAVYKFQTEQEKRISETVENNGVGFNGIDGNILSSFAMQVQCGRNLSKKQMALLFKMMPKYAGQLYEVTREEREEKTRIKKALEMCRVIHG